MNLFRVVHLKESLQYIALLF